MKYLKMLGLASVAAMAFMAFAASSASATTLEVGGVAKNESITISASVKAGTSAVLKDTFGISANTCLKSEVGGSTGVTDEEEKWIYTGATVTGPLSVLSWTECTREPITVHSKGTLHVSHIAETTNGTLTSSGAEVTVPSPFGTLTCKTGAGTHIGTLTGTDDTEAHAEVHINATIPCGISAKWTGTYVVTGPTGLGVTS